MSKPIIQLNDISASYGKRLALEKVNLTVFDDDYLGVIGPNGGGKTTLMKIILGLKKATKGTIQYFRDGKPVEELTMGYLPQYNKIDHRFPISVYEVVLSGLNRQNAFFALTRNSSINRWKQPCNAFSWKTYATDQLES